MRDTRRSDAVSKPELLGEYIWNGLRHEVLDVAG